MTHTLDIFRLETCGVLWLESAATLEHAKTRVRELAARAPGEYLVLDQKTGDKRVIKPVVGPSTVADRKLMMEGDTP